MHAIDPHTGALVWNHRMPGTHEGSGRLALSGDRVFVSYKRLVRCFSRTTGEVLATISLVFEPVTAIASEGFLSFSDLNHAVCFSDQGFLLWQIVDNPKNNTLDCHGPRGELLWSGEHQESYCGQRCGVILGSEVSQPDLGD